MLKSIIVCQGNSCNQDPHPATECLIQKQQVGVSILPTHCLGLCGQCPIQEWNEYGTVVCQDRTTGYSYQNMEGRHSKEKPDYRVLFCNNACFRKVTEDEIARMPMQLDLGMLERTMETYGITIIHNLARFFQKKLIDLLNGEIITLQTGVTIGVGMREGCNWSCGQYESKLPMVDIVGQNQPLSYGLKDFDALLALMNTLPLPSSKEK